MINENAILNAKVGSEEFIKLFPAEKPIAIQLGGCDPNKLAACSKICEKLGYDEINLNCGCPSPKVQSGKFGAILMKDPELVA